MQNWFRTSVRHAIKYFTPNMSLDEAWSKASNDYQDFLVFDNRSKLLTQIVLFFCLILILFIDFDSLTISQKLTAIGLTVAVPLYFYPNLILMHGFSCYLNKAIAGGIAIAIIIVFSFVSHFTLPVGNAVGDIFINNELIVLPVDRSLQVDIALNILPAILISLSDIIVISFTIGSFSIVMQTVEEAKVSFFTFSSLLVVRFALVFPLLATVVYITPGMVNSLLVIAGFIWGGNALLYVTRFLSKLVKRAENANERCKIYDETMGLNNIEFPSYPEFTLSRRKIFMDILRLFARYKRFTIGIAGRRGLGKTNLQHHFLNQMNMASLSEPTNRPNHDENLNQQQLKRISTICLFSPVPTKFGEMPFLLALLEQLATRVNTQLTRVLQPVKPFAIERELENKRRLLSYIHRFYLSVLVILVLCHGYLATKTPVIQNVIFNNVAQVQISSQIQELSSNQPHMELYQALRDSLYGTLQPQFFALKSSLYDIEELLDPNVKLNSWNDKGKNDLMTSLHIKATVDSLRRVKDLPIRLSIDSLNKSLKIAQSQLAMVADHEDKYYSFTSEVDSLGRIIQLETSIFSWQNSSLFLFGLSFCLLVFGVPIIYDRTKEGESSLLSAKFEKQSYEIALYFRTNELLERLKYQITLGESRESIRLAGFSKWFSFGHKHAKQISREVRPFTILSLITEYRSYIEEIKLYLGKANGGLKKIKIVIAIDELDKILDNTQLNEMLKSMKSIFEIDNVFYILSISDDALGTYRMRNMETKNEVDSSFTHIWQLPSMDAIGSLRFYFGVKKHIPMNLLPAAIVYGAGVPRDMHRLAQMINIRANWQSLKDCLQSLENEEDKHSLIDLFSENSQLSDTWKNEWCQKIKAMKCNSIQAVDDVLIEVQKLDLAKFEIENPCNGEEAQKQLFQLQSFISSLAIKCYVNYRINKKPYATPENIINFEVKRSIFELEQPEIGTWLNRLELLRAAMFGLSQNPILVWHELKDRLARDTDI